MSTLTINAAAYDRIVGHLRSCNTEQVVFLFLSRQTTPDGESLKVEDYYIVPPEELVNESRFHAEISGEAQARVIKMAWDRGLALGEIHSHPGCDRNTSFSLSDLAGFEEFVPHVRWRLKGAPYVALVFGETDFDALLWVGESEVPCALGRLSSGDRAYAPTGITIAEMERRRQDAERYKRQVGLFGSRGQALIQGRRVVVVGLGGLGCHVVQQLAYLGVTDFVLIDEDVVEWSNLNRLITATATDVGRRKVDVAAELIRRVQPNAVIQTIAASVFTAPAFEAIKGCDTVFGCVDNDGVRLGLLECCCAFRKAYLDLATDVEPDGSFGGRVVFTGIGKGCTFCREELDSKEIRRFFASDDQRAEDDRIYGVDRALLSSSGPSVVSLNGVIASLGVIEFMAFVTGLRAPQAYLVYRGGMGTVGRRDDSVSRCYYCGDIWHGRAAADVTRYVRSPDSGFARADAA